MIEDYNMWVVVIIGLVFEGLAIGFALSEDGTLAYSWICSGIASVIVWVAFHFDKNHDANFWVVLILMFLISQVPLIIKISLAKSKEAKEKSEKERKERELKQKQRQDQIEDEKRIIAHMGMIRQSSKHTAFLNFVKNHFYRIIIIYVNTSGQVTVRLSNSNPVIIPDYKAGHMVINNPYDYKDYYFFGAADNERNWTVFEVQALARIIDEDMRSLGGFSCSEKRNDGFRRYEVILPDEPVLGNRPY